MMRLLPRGLTSQLLLLLAAALIAANLLALLLLSYDRRDAARHARMLADLERVASLVPTISFLEGKQRARVVRASSRRFLRLRVSPTPAVRGQIRAANLEARFAEEAGIDAGSVRIFAPSGSPLRQLLRSWDGRRSRGPAPGVLVSVRLPGGEWLNARLVRPRRNSSRTGAAVLAAMGFSLVIVLIVAALFVRRLTGPIRGLADAARQAGRGDRTARAPVVGTRETRDAAQAFNSMQADIARFDAERARVVAAVGHDLRTPITSLRIRAEMLDDDQSGPMVRILDEMRVMADGLLAWSRGEAETEQPDAVDLAVLLRELCENSPAPHMHYDGPDHLTIHGRPVALSRAFSNLVDNACQYGKGGKTLLIPGNPVIISVEDNGPGIPEERIEELLEPFARGEVSRSVETGGAGLGLSIARTIIRAHGGTLSLSIRPEGGLRATVELPCDPASSA